MSRILYLHGFNSGFDEQNDKVLAVAELGEVVGVTYDSFARREVIMEQLERVLEGRGCQWCVGTSLGGYYAAYLGQRWRIPSVVINPAEDPYTILARAVGEELVNPKTGEVCVLSQEVLDTYRGYRLRGMVFEKEPLLLLDEGDELLDYRETLAHCGTWPHVIFSGGTHRFSHMSESIAMVRRYVGEWSESEEAGGV